MSDTEQILSDQEILDRILAFESEGFPHDECIVYAEFLAKHCPSGVAKEAIGVLVKNFPDDHLGKLVRKHVAPSLDPENVDCCQGPRASVLAIILKDRGFDVRLGWRVTWTGGEVIEGENLCRLALLAVWIRGDELEIE